MRKLAETIDEIIEYYYNCSPKTMKGSSTRHIAEIVLFVNVSMITIFANYLVNQ